MARSPDFHIDRRHPKEPPTHIATAIGEALNQVDAIPKSTTGASMPGKDTPKEPVRPPPKSNETPPADTPREPDATTAPPARSPGRPRSNRIEFFATDTFLRQNRKFIKLKKKLGISEEKTWTIITSMFCYVAQSEALTPVINDIELFAEFCYWDDDPQILINALISVNLITENYRIPGWFQNQPFAAKKLHDHRLYKKQKEEQQKQQDN